MSTTIQPYLTFGGRCDEAIEFYKKAIGATVEILMRFDQSPDPVPEGMLAPGFESKVMHATLRVSGAVLMVTDGCAPGGSFEGTRLSLGVATEQEADKAFAGLADGGKVEMPLCKTFWSPKFGMVTDKFGVGWMVTIPGEAPK